MQPDPNFIWNPGDKPLRITNQLYQRIRISGLSANVSDVTDETDDSTMDDSDDDSMESGDVESRTELDSHANMGCAGKHAYIIADVGKYVEVSPFSPDYEPIRVPLVDAAIQYDDPYTGDTIILVLRNVLYVKSMEVNLIPPFMMREAGIVVNDTPKIQTDEPTANDHSIIFPETEFRIPLFLHGVFSYFPTTKPKRATMAACENVYLLTPTRWNPHCDSYARNEEAMLDWQGNIVAERDRAKRIMLEEVESDEAMAASLRVSDDENAAVDSLLEDLYPNAEQVIPMFEPTPLDADQISCVMADISPMYCDMMLLQKLEERASLGRFQMSIGSTDVGYSGDDNLCIESDYDDYNNLLNINDDDTNGCELDEDEMADDFVNVDGQIESLLDECLDGEIDLDEVMAAAATARRPVSSVNPEHLSKIWRISHEDAKRTIETTTQHCVRTQDPTLSRNYGTNDRMLRYKRIDTHFFMDTFFATSKVQKSKRGNTCCQLFVTDKGYVYVVPMKSKSEVLLAVKQFAKEIGAPDAIICDMSGEQTSKAVRQFCSEIGTTLKVLEEGTPWANRAELYIGLIKEAVRKDMQESDSPLIFWDYCLERRVSIHNLTARGSFKLQGQCAYTDLTGEQGDISKLCQYEWYGWCYYRDQKAAFPMNKERLGRVLGPTRGEGNEMCQYVLQANGVVVPRRSLRPLRVAELHSPVEAKKREIFDKLITRKYGSTFQPRLMKKPKKQANASSMEYHETDEEESQEKLEVEDVVDSTGRLINQQPLHDVLLHSELYVQHGDEYVVGKVARRALNPDGKVVGSYDPDPFLNSIIYEVELPDGSIKEVGANIIAENILSQVDEDGFSTTLMEAIVDYRVDTATAVRKGDHYVYTKSGQRRLRKTTLGWEFLLRWRDGNETWVKLKDLKDSHPVELAEFAKARGIADEPAFVWWVPHTLRKRDVIIASIKKRIRKTTHKYGIEIPRDTQHAIELDKQNGNTFWQDALAKEMKNVGLAFQVLDEGEKAPIGWHKVTGHLVWDVKMDFTRKARWVLDGHKTPDAVYSTYAGVVSRESVRIAFTYAALNGLDVQAADIQNAYIQAPSSRKDYIICGPEFGLENVGRVALIHRALYGGKTAGRDFRNHLRGCMRHLNFTSCPADPDVWMRPAIKSDGTEYYEYVLLYTDDALVVSENGERILRDEIGKYFKLKEESIGPPKIYLGGSVRQVTLQNGVKAYAFGSAQYVKNAVKNVKEHIKKSEHKHWKMPKVANTPMQTSYRPELDISAELDSLDASYYQSLIGILRWMVELGRVDLCLEVSMMSSHLAMPRQGHLEQLFHIFSYLHEHYNGEIVFDPTEPEIDHSSFEEQDWTTSEFGHVIGKEVLPPNMPAPRGKGFIMTAMVDADHASDTVSRRSRTGFLVYLNSALVYWHSKKQTSVESSSFGSEFCAMKACCEYLRGLRYKLRMMGIPVEGPVYISGDNQSVLANTTIPDSTLKKKSQSIAYHYVREGVARGEWRTSYVNTNDNWSDLLTKMLPFGDKRRRFVRSLIHHVYREYDDYVTDEVTIQSILRECNKYFDEEE